MGLQDQVRALCPTCPAEGGLCQDPEPGRSALHGMLLPCLVTPHRASPQVFYQAAAAIHAADIQALEPGMPILIEYTDVDGRPSPCAHNALEKSQVTRIFAGLMVPPASRLLAVAPICLSVLAAWAQTIGPVLSQVAVVHAPCLPACQHASGANALCLRCLCDVFHAPVTRHALRRPAALSRPSSSPPPSGDSVPPG